MPEKEEPGTLGARQSTPSLEADFGTTSNRRLLPCVAQETAELGHEETLKRDGLLMLLEAAEHIKSQEKIEAAESLLQLSRSAGLKRSHATYKADIIPSANVASSPHNFEFLGSKFTPINPTGASPTTKTGGIDLLARPHEFETHLSDSAQISTSREPPAHSSEPAKKKRRASRRILATAENPESCPEVNEIRLSEISSLTHAQDVRANEHVAQSNRSQGHLASSVVAPSASSSKESPPTNSKRDTSRRTRSAASDQETAEKNIGKYFEEACQKKVPQYRSLEGVETAKLIFKHPNDNHNDVESLEQQYPHGQNRAMLLKQVEEAKALVLKIWEEVGPDACMFVYVLREVCGDEAVKIYQNSAPNSTMHGCEDPRSGRCPVNYPKYSAYWDQPLGLAELHDKVMRTVVSDKFGRNMTQTRDLIIRKTCLHRSCFQRGSYRKKMKYSIAFLLLRLQLAMIYLDYNDQDYCNVTFTHRLKASDETRLQSYLQDKHEAARKGQEFEEPKNDEKETPCWLLEILSDRYLMQKADENIDEMMLWNFALVDYIEELWRREDVEDVLVIAPIMFIPETNGSGQMPPKHVPKLTPEEASTIQFELKDPATRPRLETRKAKPPIYPGKRFPGWHEPDRVTNQANIAIPAPAFNSTEGKGDSSRPMP